MRIIHGATAVAAAVCGLGVLPGLAGAAPSVATTWAGWDAAGPAGVGAPSHVAAFGGTVAVLGSDSRNGTLPISVSGPGGARIGRVPITGSSAADSIALAGPGRLLLAFGCRVARSANLGETWDDVALEGCTVGTAVGIRALDDRVAYASSTGRTWRTLDGGATWAVVNGSESGPQLLLDADTGLRIVNPAKDVYALQRTLDGGRSWQGLKVPDPRPPAPDPAVPVDPPVVPAPTDPPTEPKPPVPIAVDSLPVMAGLARRSDGHVLVGAGSNLLVSSNRGEGFSSVPVPVPDDLPGAPAVVVDDVVCDSVGGCIVGVHAANDAARRSALRFDGGAFGARVAALPTRESQSVGPNVIVGITTTAARETSAVRTDDGGASPYRELASSRDERRSIGVHGLLAIPNVGRLHLSSDGGATWSDVPNLGAPQLVRVAHSSRGLIGLANDGTVWMQTDGEWARQADLSALRPSGMAVSSGTPFVVGGRGISSLADPAKPAAVSARVLQGRGFGSVVAKGRTIIAWSGRKAVRSVDGGRRWSRISLPAGVDDLQLVSPKVAFALVSSRGAEALYRSTNAAGTFRRRASLPRLGSAGPLSEDSSSTGAVEFASATAGIVLTGHGAYVTRDAGKNVEILPTPGASIPVVASVYGSSVAVLDPTAGSVFRRPGLLTQRAPGLTLRSTGTKRSARKSKPRRQARSVTVVGVLKGAQAGRRVALVAVRRGGAPGRLLTVRETNADGSFRTKLKLSRSESGVQAWFAGSVAATSTDRGARSSVLVVH